VSAEKPCVFQTTLCLPVYKSGGTRLVASVLHTLRVKPYAEDENEPAVSMPSDLKEQVHKNYADALILLCFKGRLD
jgi:hypothetical protein